MSIIHALSLGGLNKVTGKYVYPKIANKGDQYVCPDCNKDLTLCQGEIRIPYFRHKIDAIHPCNHYSSPSESQIHKDAKLLMKELLDSKTPVTMVRTCSECKTKDEFEILEMADDSVIELEHRFTHNGGTKIADVAYLDDGELFCIFEICHTHKTEKENRPDPWFEINAKKLIASANDRLWDKTIACMRCELCEACAEKNTLTHRKRCMGKRQLCDWLEQSNENGIYPLLFRDYDGFYNDVDNEFNKYFDVVFGDKGNYRYGINLADVTYNQVELQKFKDYGIGVYNIDFHWVLSQTNVPTEIVCIRIIDEYYVQQATKQIEVDDDDMGFRAMRRDKQDYNYAAYLKQMQKCIDNGIKYKEGNNILTIEHPITKIKIRRSYCKTYINGVWEDRVEFKEVSNWYKSVRPNRIDTMLDYKAKLLEGSTLKYVLTGKNQTERKNMLSKYLQSHVKGELSDVDQIYFKQVFQKFYTGEKKAMQTDIQRVFIENDGYGGKCFQIEVNNMLHPTSIKRLSGGNK